VANPWLEIPLADYEGHMSSAEVQQLEALSDLFAAALKYCQPSSVAILGVAGGNGLKHVNRAVTRRIVGLDINPCYLDEVRQRFDDIELHCMDLAEERIDLQPVNLVHAALVFEHAGTDLCLDNAIALVAKDGALSVVLQLPSELAQGVSASPFPSLQKLKAGFTMIEPLWLKETLQGRGFELLSSSQRSLPAGKSFWMGIFHRRQSAL
jgi:hypothetical protein